MYQLTKIIKIFCYANMKADKWSNFTKLSPINRDEKVVYAKKTIALTSVRPFSYIGCGY